MFLISRFVSRHGLYRDERWIRIILVQTKSNLWQSKEERNGKRCLAHTTIKHEGTELPEALRSYSMYLYRWRSGQSAVYGSLIGLRSQKEKRKSINQLPFALSRNKTKYRIGIEDKKPDKNTRQSINTDQKQHSPQLHWSLFQFVILFFYPLWFQVFLPYAYMVATTYS